MYEVELKVAAAHDEVRPELESLGARRVDAVRQVDTYYNAPDRDFATTDEALRIRREHPSDADSVAAVTYKGPLVESESKTREEAETHVADADAMAAILDGLGYEPAATVEKDRERYAIDEYTVTLDAVDDLGEFVEVETEVADTTSDAESAISTARAGAADVLHSLGLDPDEQIRTSYLGLLLATDNSD